MIGQLGKQPTGIHQSKTADIFRVTVVCFFFLFFGLRGKKRVRAVCCGMVCVFIHVLGYNRMIFVRESVWFIQLIVFVYFSVLFILVF